MTRDQVHEHILDEILPSGPTVAYASEDYPYDLLCRSRGLYASQGSVEDALILMNLMLDVPDLSRFARTDSEREKMRDDYDYRITQWVYAWLLLNPEPMNEAFRLRANESEHWRDLLDFCAHLLHERCLTWIQQITDLAVSRDLLDVGLKQRLSAVTEKIKTEINHPDNAQYDGEEKDLLTFYSES